MQVSSKDIIFLIGLSSVIFLIAPLFLIIYVLLYNRRKKKHAEEKEMLQKNYTDELLKTQMEVQEQTLKTIAYNLHDNIGQLLSLIAITVSSININDADKSSEKLATVEDLAKRSIKEVKALSRLLHAEELLVRGLTPAIEAELDWLKRSDRYVVNYKKLAEVSFEDNNKGIIVFRLFQEIINNIIQHAHATQIFITLDKLKDAHQITIRDNGIGFNVDNALKNKTGMGLQNITKRVAMINGTASISSVPGFGSFIILEIPCNH